ncbi:DNA-binding GntR family transcriptional regulator [Comamonas odontotermitis]|uniref:DNA-binding GntR family transcriptional regulator n=1 Tax=Comamonas odontotermitis TaxID=379895 RepID=A0ABR6RGN8_9BURK|nr:DNA-binding GntR family transcriptional regulator [Comamonas odontotermitis]
MQTHSLCIAIADKLRTRILNHQMPPGSDITTVRWPGSLA